ncbi:MAG TPA: formate dehydrogenase accessory sulfurtransferase FdhD [Chloroflexota bacterium]|nr:formate dehydrogenase accessory sulfurtransferase FdhD [Chloroflexota bacterium]
MALIDDAPEQGSLQPERGILFSADATATVVRWRDAQSDQRPDLLAPEAPLEIRLAGRPLTVTMRTPGHDEELAAGLLFAQELLRDPADLGPIERDPAQPNRIDVSLSAVLDSEERWRRYTYASSSCGICGVESLEALALTAPPVTSDVTVRIATLYDLPERLRAAQESFGSTGGTHAAGLFDSDGRLLVAREDVGRHNAVDKVVGHALQHGLMPLDHCLLMVSGRISYEIVQKALMARLPIIAAVSAPTNLAVHVARAQGITLAGFLRGHHVNVYSHPARICA